MDRGPSQHQYTQASDDELFDLLRSVAEPGRASDQIQAFEVLFQRYHAKVFHWCRRFVTDEQLAEDVAQKVFLELFERAPRSEKIKRFGPWLYVVTRSRCLNALRSRRRERSEELSPELLEYLQADDNPLQDSENRELRARIDEVCAKHLKALEQEVVHLRYTLGFKVAEITALLDLKNASGARTHLRSAENKLRRHLGNLLKERNEK